jgi:hypothetical protein
MAHSADGGNIFDATVNVSGSAGVSDNVVTVATPSGIHHVWIDPTPGNPDTFYRHGIP